jgi:hypothetical protein
MYEYSTCRPLMCTFGSNDLEVSFGSSSLATCTGHELDKAGDMHTSKSSCRPLTVAALASCCPIAVLVSLQVPGSYPDSQDTVGGTIHTKTPDTLMSTV